MTPALVRVLSWLAPPLLGAIIGYVTNTIAIRMLFRPLRPWYIWKWRLPLTPGIIPSKRGELAMRIGEMVGSHLVTGEEVGRALERDAFRRELRMAVADRLDALLHRELGPAAELVPERFRVRFDELAERLRWQLSRELFLYLESPVFAQRLRCWLQERGERLLSRDVAGLLPPQQRLLVENHLRRLAKEWIQSAATGRAAAHMLDEQLSQWLDSDASLRDWLPAELVAGLLDRLEAELPALLERLVAMLQQPEIREGLLRRAQEAIQKFIASLGGLSGLVSSFLKPETISRHLPGLLDRGAEQLSAFLAEEQTRQQIAELLRQRLEGLLDRPVRDLLARVPYGRIARVKRALRARVVVLVRGDAGGRLADAVLDQLLTSVRGRTLGELLAAGLPEGGLERGQAALAERLLAVLCSPTARAVVEAELAVLAQEWLYRRPLGRLSARMSSEARAELEEALGQQLTELLRKEVPALVESLDVRSMVEDKVNGLDILEVEGLLLGIMQEQFKYINLFGALLGGLIGLVNLLLLLWL
ncbi:DUF445 family protein [Desulfuromonas sp. CSMB_57]|jgi:uncharacterized membrane protein YheB (UPF0754 family)|uniref:DUF445 family protein n=1 Tax=Desulfuromonas sp. CSMB_57 TaxID=2807629 RepID=UPI001CD49232|nr:DUF445 family protein [Desulfuromonas sp. CSMB_57]